ncbi:UvrD-helicase domain-containing protein [Gynuella sp.]|uniref:UvrD-helicase domain-containing protein n=1 Tax=Gynuella sp. TaxID=2969146 RepID=UPI003D128025
MVDIIDTQARIDALNIQQSILCEAPAGSGKTELLTQRFLKLLALVDQPEKIWAITFTKKAAQEMRDRIIRSLRKANDPEPLVDHEKNNWQLANAAMANDQRHGWNLIQNPGRLSVRTFDSLCAFLVKNLPLNTSFGASVQPVENPQPLYQEAVRSLLHAYDQNPDVDWGPALERMLAHRDNLWTDFEKLAIEMLRSRDQWLHALPLIFDPANSSDEDLQQLQQMLHVHATDLLVQVFSGLGTHNVSELEPLMQFCISNLQQEQNDSLAEVKITDFSLQPDAKNMVFFRFLANSLLTQKGEWKKRLDKRSGFPTGKGINEQNKKMMQSIIVELSENNQLRMLLKQLQEFPDLTTQSQDQDIIRDLMVLLPQLVAHLFLVFRQHNQVDFAEISLKALQALEHDDAPTDLALALDYQLQHLMVDEFQDTSFSQVRLIDKLTQNWHPNDGKTLFCVGDAMQSIYGFRAAKVGLFMNIRDHGIGNISLKRIRLQSNFRSHQQVVEWVNRTFSQVLPPQDNIQYSAVSYHPSTAIKSALPLPVTVHVAVDDFADNSEAAHVVEQIRQIKQQAPSASIAVLAKNRNHLQPTIELLRRQKIPFQAVDIYSLKKLPAINDICLLHEALRYPGNSLVWLSLMRSPLLGLKLDQIAAINQLALEEKRTHLSILSSILRQDISAPEIILPEISRILFFIEEINQAYQYKARYFEQQWLDMIWRRLGGYVIYPDSNSHNAVHSYLQLISQLDQPCSMREVHERLERLFINTTVQESTPVQIMTMHKSKGLEFDHVFLVGLNKLGRSDEPGFLLWEETVQSDNRANLLLAPIESRGGTKTGLYKYLNEFNKIKQKFEQGRLLYVACTRAIQSLHLSFCTTYNAETEMLKPPSANSLAGEIWPEIQNLIDVIPVADLTTAPTELSASTRITRLKHRATADSEPHSGVLDPWRLASPPPENLFNHPEQEFNTLERRLGTVIHRFLEKHAAGWNPDNERIQNWLLNEALRHAIPQVEQPTFMSRASRMLTNISADERLQWLLTADGADYSRSEYQLVFKAGGRMRTLIIDRIVVHDNTTWLVDYKTSCPKAGQTLEEFLEHESQVYQSQMDIYRKALMAKNFPAIKMYLYFPEISHWHQLLQ